MTDNNASFHSGFVAIIGRPNVGKSTLLNQILGQKIAITSNKPQTTRNRILGIHNLDDAQVLFLDTPGIHAARDRFNRYMVDQAVMACDDVDLILLLVEAGTGRGLDKQILDVLKRTRTRVMLVINKIDTVPRTELLPQLEAFSRQYEFAELVPVSAQTGEGVEHLVSAIRSYLPEGPRLYPEEMVTDLPERFIVAEMIREKIFRMTSKEVPYGIAVQVETFEEKPEKNLVVIGAVVHVEKETHKSIILGKQGAMVKRIGKAAREDIERLLGTRVFLEIFVRIQKDWTRSPHLLREMGYE
ncbi:MAG: GTPase Era [Desulfuromonas sp.]|nr:MAG: GTPase Era [Desulfuromonas sp.]